MVSSPVENRLASVNLTFLMFSRRNLWIFFKSQVKNWMATGTLGQGVLKAAISNSTDYNQNTVAITLAEFMKTFISKIINFCFGKVIVYSEDFAKAVAWFSEKAVLKNFAAFTRKNLQGSLFVINLQHVLSTFQRSYFMEPYEP